MRVCALLAASAALLIAAPIAGAAPAQPAQPASGPGGSDAPHASFRVTEGGMGDDAFFVFEPTEPKPASAPLAVITHGYFEFSGYAQMQALIEHTVREGNVVVYPRYQTGVIQPCPGPQNIEPCVASTANGIRGALKLLKADPDRVQPKPNRTSYFGFSFGGIITANLANRYEQLGLPEPKAVFLEDPHDGGFTGDREPALDDDLGGVPATTLFQCHSGADGVFNDPYYLNATQLKPDASCNAVFPKLTSIPVTNKDIVLTSDDAHGEPALSSTHGVCAGTAADAYDWGFCWKVFDALRSCAYVNADCDYALGDTARHRHIGTWSDGTPIVGLKVQEEAPIRGEPVPAREPEPMGDQPPGVRLTRTARRIIRGVAYDDVGIARVEVAVVRKRGARRFVRATGAARWKLRLRPRLAPGAYRVVARAVDSAGQVGPAARAQLRVRRRPARGG